MSSVALTIDQDTWRPKYNPWLIAVVVALAAFMEVLDTSIANVALPYIAGNLGASNDQSTFFLKKNDRWRWRANHRGVIIYLI
jgi:MFS transporter, DHA2 family, multidrug resistance protein